MRPCRVSGVSCALRLYLMADLFINLAARSWKEYSKRKTSRESGCPPSCLVRDGRTTRDPRVLAASRVVMVAGIEWFRPAPLLGVMR